MNCIFKGHWRHREYAIVHGAFVGTSDDREDRWYIDHVDATTADRRGEGFRTLADCREYIDLLHAVKDQRRRHIVRIYADLTCPHCNEWIGDPDNADIASISVRHDISKCEERNLC